MNYWPEFLTVAVVHLLAVMSPGPDFVLASRNSLAHSRRIGIYTSIGLALGIMTHAAYSLVGIGLIISKSLLLFSAIKLLGAGYLAYIGYRCLRAKPQHAEAVREEAENKLEPFAAMRMGYLTNILNPKVTLFFLALFTQVVNPQTPKFIQALYGMEMSLMTFCWFSFVVILLSHRAIRNRFARVQHYLERAFGVILIGLGIKVALSSSR